MINSKLTSTKLSILSAGILAALTSTASFATEKERVIVTVSEAEFANTLPVSVSGAELNQFKSDSLSLFADRVQSTAKETLPSVNAVVMELTQEEILQLSQNSSVLNIEVDPKRYIPEVFDATSITPLAETTPYGINMVQALQVSDGYTSNRKVCIMDTGYKLGHPDLPNTGITGNDGYGSYDTGVWTNDGNGHGTHVAGTIAALGGNNTGVVGVNRSGQLGLHIVKVFNDSGRWAYGSNLIKAIEQCETAGAHVTSMSLGGSGSSTAERTAFSQSAQRGMLHIAAAGNGGNSSSSYPASYDAVVSVAAVDSSERKASFSQYNSQVEIAGPGVGVNSTWNNNGYRSISGTSMATPHVSGVAALVWSHYPQCSASQIRNALNKSAKDKGSAGRDTSYGYGIVQAKAAYDFLANGCDGGDLPVDVVANFSAKVNGLSVQFTNTSTAGTYNWSFGDGATSTQSSPSYTYSAAGDYQVTLKVTNSKGQTASKTQTVTVTDNNSGSCNGLPAWNASTFYSVGVEVQYNGNKYQSIWWSRGATPTVFTNVWRRTGSCN